MPLPVDQHQLRELVTGSENRQILCQKLAAMTSGFEVQSLTLTRCKFKPSRSLRASYSVAIDDKIWPIVVTWRHDGAHQWQSHDDLAAEAMQSISPSPFSSLHAYCDELDASIMIWPLDPIFPKLPALLRWCRSNGSLVTAIRYRPGERHVLRVTHASSGGSEFVKLDRSDNNKRIDAALVALAETATQAHADVVPVDALHADADNDHEIDCSIESALIGPDPTATAINGAPTYLEATGKVVSNLEDLQVVADAVGEVGRLAAMFHTADVEDVDGLSERRIDEELALVARACEHIVWLAPDLADAVAELISHVAEQMEPCAPSRLVHGDLKLDHIFTSSSGVQLIDLDGFRLADPASDLAKLMAELRFFAIDQMKPGMDRIADSFVGAYAAVGDPKIVERARLLEPALLLKMAARRIPVSDRQWRTRVGAVVDEATLVVGALGGDDRR